MKVSTYGFLDYWGLALRSLRWLKRLKLVERRDSGFGIPAHQGSKMQKLPPSVLATSLVDQIKGRHANCEAWTSSFDATLEVTD